MLAFDPAITANTRIDNQFSYVRNGCPQLKPVVEALPDITTSDALTEMDNCEVVVVSQLREKIRNQVVPRSDRIKIIGLVRLFDEWPKFSSYESIGW